MFSHVLRHETVVISSYVEQDGNLCSLSSLLIAQCIMEPVKSACIIIALFILEACAMSSGVQKFLLENGHRHVDLFYNSSDWRRFTLKNVFISRISFEDVYKGHKHSFGIFIYKNEKDDLLSVLSAINQRPIKKSLLIISEPWTIEELNIMKEHLLELQSATLFYITMPIANHTDMSWYQMISLRSGSALNQLKFYENSSRIVETYDMNGLEITSSSLTWAPYLTIDDCNEHGLECAKNYGYLIDLMDKLAIQYNFTFISQKNLNDSWWHFGTDGIFGGVWGDVQSKQHDLSLSAWTWILSRHDLFDFVPFIKDGYILAFIPKPSNTNLNFVTQRVFARDTWTTLLCISGAAFIASLISTMCGVAENMNGIQILTFTWWLYFTLVYSYYCGVLTMFFTVPAPVFFETLKDVVDSYPDWKLMLLDGSQGGVYERAAKGDPDYVAIWQQYEDNNTDTLFNSMESGLQYIENGNNVMFVDKNQLLGHMKSHSTLDNMHIINAMTRDHGLACLLLHDNSPLLPMFNQGVRYIRENGLERQLFYKWFGNWENQNGSTPPEGHIISLREMLTSFAGMLVVFVVALFLLCGELTFKRLFSPVTGYGQRGGTQFDPLDSAKSASALHDRAKPEVAEFGVARYSPPIRERAGSASWTPRTTPSPKSMLSHDMTSAIEK